jgi:FtsH-binding integral membrane protein
MISQTDYIILEKSPTHIDTSDIAHQKIVYQNIRTGFIQKVYGILASQLLITVAFCVISIYNHTFRTFQLNNLWLFFFAMMGTAVIPLIIFCYDDITRKTPDNYIFLGLFTISESYLVSFICIFTSPKIVLMAMLMTFALVLALTVYAIKTKTDFTLKSSALFLFGIGALLFSLFAIFTSNKLVYILVCTLFVILFGAYLIYDTQMIIGNKNHDISIDDYMLASFLLYVDIINLFLNLLQLMGLLEQEPM